MKSSKLLNNDARKPSKFRFDRSQSIGEKNILIVSTCVCLTKGKRSPFIEEALGL